MAERLASERVDMNLKGRVEAIVRVQRPAGDDTPPVQKPNDPSKTPWAK